MADGQYRIPAGAIRRVFAECRTSAQGERKPNPGRITRREREILTLFAQGLSYAESAEVRGNRPVTVRNAIYDIQDRL